MIKSRFMSPRGDFKPILSPQGQPRSPPVDFNLKWLELIHPILSPHGDMHRLEVDPGCTRESTSRHSRVDNDPMSYTYTTGCTDCMMLRFRTISYGDVVIIDASLSRDPVNISTLNETETLEAIWSVTRYVDTATLDAFLANAAPIPQTPTYHKIQNGTEYGLRLNTSLFSSGDTLLVMFTLSRGSRRSTVYQLKQGQDRILCANWTGNVLNPHLTYLVRQVTANTRVPSEPILKTSTLK
ncbi:hypothetical protein DPMN_119566 [Dreissena polymorpha]|uniref:Uncharacterized protein n=1 Tax=Dreissena polymorpha TaxID=45954 RepID=A0A9D4GIE9_DREPO|nr:hypothetical protein DPMN_119566 [Dreissena polymorpha]